jgi:uncharacterized protein YxjI
MDSILEKNLYLFKEHIGLFKASNNYDIYDPESKNIILNCREKNLNPAYKIIRIFFQDFKRMTPFEIDITRLDGRKILKVKKGFSLFLSKVQVFDENDKIIGILKQKLFPIGNNFDMLDKNETLVCKLKGNLIGWNFKFIQNNKEIGLVTKKWSGIGKEMFTSADNYILEIKENVNKDNAVRLLILAAVICIDMVIKE